VLLLFVPVVGKNRLQLGVGCRIDALLVSVHGLQLLHEADDCPMQVARLRREMLL
jgi:hypothetical protein